MYPNGVNEKMAATFAAPAMKKRNQRKKMEELEKRISKLEEEVKKLKK
jgi:cell division protein FtsB